jgi:MarR family transcriptional regulator for hemolysin
MVRYDRLMPRLDGPAHEPPLGLLLAHTAKAVSRAFDDALSAAGGSMSTWLILLTLKTRTVQNQRELAEAVGIGEATLTHHLDSLERNGLVRRTRDKDNRRVQRVELTDAGESSFLRLRKAAIDFDKRLRRGLNASHVDAARQLLSTLRANVHQA